jgi:hypothetical protein
VDTEGGLTFQVSQYTFNNGPIALGRSMHKLKYFVHSIVDVWYSKGEILKSANNLAEASGIRKQLTRLQINF